MSPESVALGAGTAHGTRPPAVGSLGIERIEDRERHRRPRNHSAAIAPNLCSSGPSFQTLDLRVRCGSSVRRRLKRRGGHQLVLDRRKIPGELAAGEDGSVIGPSWSMVHRHCAAGMLVDLGGVGNGPAPDWFRTSATLEVERTVQTAKTVRATS